MIEGKKTSAQIKAIARQALMGNYGKPVGASIIVYMLNSLFTMLLLALVLLFGSFMYDGRDSGALAVAVILLLSYVLYLGINQVLIAGYTRICYQIAMGKESSINDLFYGFKHHPMRFVGLSCLLVLCLIVVVLLSLPLRILSVIAMAEEVMLGLLLYVLGIIVELVLMIVIISCFLLAIFILVENPERTLGEVFRINWELLRGNWWRIIRLQLSFVGIALVGFLSLGIGLLWVMPYQLCTYTVFYRTLKEEQEIHR